MATESIDIKAPFNRAYWVIPGKLMAGCYPGDTDDSETAFKIENLLRVGIRNFINLMERGEVDWKGRNFNPYESLAISIAGKEGLKIAIDSMPIKDTWIPTRTEMGEILDRIDESIDAIRPVYVHCWGGRGRTGTAIGCYLARHGYGSDDEILNMIQALRHNTEDSHLPSPETSQQIDMVKSWVKWE